MTLEFSSQMISTIGATTLIKSNSKTIVLGSSSQGTASTLTDMAPAGF
jgi:hypothetical protein